MHYDERLKRYKLNNRKRRLYKKRIRLIKMGSALVLTIVVLAKMIQMFVSVPRLLHKPADNPDESVIQEPMLPITNTEVLPVSLFQIEAAHTEPKSPTPKNSIISNILANRDEYTQELIELVQLNPETLSFVVDYPLGVQGVYDAQSIQIQADLNHLPFPQFKQWDKRWGYAPYGSSVLGMAGCGPTSLSIVITGLTGNTQANPLAVANYSIEQGYVTTENASSWELFTQGAAHFGVVSRELPRDAVKIKNALADGQPVIASMQPGIFTTTGHIIVLTGLTADGQITVSDPNSIERTNTSWDIDVFIEQGRNFWAYTKGTL